MTDPKTGNDYPNIRKIEEFDAFLDLLRGDTTAHWVQIADAIGINKDTVTEWRKHPSAQKAIRDGIERALEGMEKAGKDDWKMWESKLRMLGLIPKEQMDITSGGKPIPIFGNAISTDNGDKEAPSTQ